MHETRDVLDDDDGVVDHEPSRKRNAEERERVDREAEQLQSANVPISEIGIVIIGISVMRQS